MRNRDSFERSFSRMERSHSRIENIITTWAIMIPFLAVAFLAGLGWLVWVLLTHFGIL